MENLAATLDRFTVDLAAEAPSGQLRGLTDDALLLSTAAIERLGRQVDALRVAAAGEVADRSRKDRGAESLATQKGCRNAIELMERVTLVSGATASRRLKLGKETRIPVSLIGVDVPARFPRVAEALNAGAIGVDSAMAIVSGLTPVLGHASPAELDGAEAELVAAATGISATVDDAASSDSSPAPLPCAAGEVEIQATVWRAVIDPDGLEPSEERAMTNRMVTRGVLRDGLVHGKFALMPEIAAKLNRLFDAYIAPTTTGVFLTEQQRLEAESLGDTRTAEQQRHDVLAAMADAFARSGDTPTIGGAAPTVLVSVRGDDLKKGRGAGWIDGLVAPISMSTVQQFACTGGIQPITIDSFGAIIELGSPQRTFNRQQRRAIALRDGACIVPGCNIPAGWTEIHHVDSWANLGLTHTDNGVCLCWFHHRTIDTSGWEIRMIRGAPHLKAPPWIDPTGTWRPATKSRTAAADGLTDDA